ncbi:MAG TPA: threonylcarbamoyl-AMP synthase [Myxococcales bacterium]|nr:threonylcarbamoyl-AMP synthase [Myxococcales bacterium]HIN85571.1 threonylcarbamoyl-AMP synthase [Myxococcales bacterium]
MYLDMDPDYPEVWRMGEIARLVEKGAVGVIPTDTVYAFVCDCTSKKAIERIYGLKNLDPKKPLSMICKDISEVSRWTRGFPHNWFRTMRRCLPGPYTFIVSANQQTPRIMLKKRREIGVRIPDDLICQALLEELDRPLLCSSVRTPEDSFWNDPAKISESFGNRLDFVVDGGERFADPSTVINLTGGDAEIIRRGKGSTDLFE